MVTIKVFGTLRLKTACRSLEADISSVKEACRVLSETTGLPMKEFKNCVITVNGKQSKFSARLTEGDEVGFFSPSGGG